ncbi:hypothetical protein jhhlp_003908 [Lomentospora prolificans]|uniref:Sensitive to high expression protein 9, mitochondrial n=1 Tax=Lomentospora prolificans TaxID=41688 RepID=A0A2N3NA45_9PEZI|nr:hypothetical protein jhhlp_003908 [Lomentospora prolificans]
MASSLFRPLRTATEAMRFPPRTVPDAQLRMPRRALRPAILGRQHRVTHQTLFFPRGYSTTPPDRPSSHTPLSSESTSSKSSSNPSPSSEESPQPADSPAGSAPSEAASSQEPASSSSSSSSSSPSSSSSSSSSTTSSELHGELPSAADSRRSNLAARFSTFMDNLQDRYVDGLQAFNSITGYSAIEAITANNAQLEKSLVEARAAMREARERYQDTSARQVQTQRDMATLLARKASWMQSDKNQFAELLDLDYKLEKEVGDAAKAVAEVEGKEQSLLSEWVAGMSRQYYEHQVYSDRIRRASTWGTWGLMGVNVLLFLMLQFVAEPWKRGRLLNSMEEREAKLLDRVDGRIDEGFGQMRGELHDTLEALKPTVAKESQEMATSAAAEEPAPAPTWSEVLKDPRLLKGPLVNAYETVRAELRVKDMVAIGLQSAIIVLLLRN